MHPSLRCCFTLSRFANNGISLNLPVLFFKKHGFSTSSSCAKNIGVLGAPFWQGQPKPGTENGPQALRAGKLIEELKGLGHDVKDYGDIERSISSAEQNESRNNHAMKNASAVGTTVKKISESVSKILKDGRTCLTLGGDHSIGMATVHGHAQVHGNTSVVWVDAHADLNTPSSSTSGNIHGMPCSFIIREMQKFSSPIPGFESITPCIDAKNVVYIGLRDVDPMERVYLDKLNILNFSMREIDKLGIFKVIEQTLERINAKSNSVHVSFDIDAVDRLYAPSTGTPVFGGLSVREAFCIAEEFSKLENLHSLDMVEVNPQLGTPEEVQRTVKLANDIIASFFGKCRGGNYPLNSEKLSMT